jgi:hypothetical protein
LALPQNQPSLHAIVAAITHPLDFTERPSL